MMNMMNRYPLPLKHQRCSPYDGSAKPAVWRITQSCLARIVLVNVIGITNTRRSCNSRCSQSYEAAIIFTEMPVTTTMPPKQQEQKKQKKLHFRVAVTDKKRA